jgi:hypothetical protein
MGLNSYTSFISIHAENAAASHSVIAFMIWHREFIHRFETALQQIDASVTLPYLDFSLDWRRPAASLIFGADMFGGANVGSIDFGVLANLTTKYPSPHFVLRFLRTGPGGFGGNTRQFKQPVVMRNVRKDGTLPFSAFVASIENVHAVRHICVVGAAPTGSNAQNYGVTSGDLVFTGRSPSDPSST